MENENVTEVRALLRMTYDALRAKYNELKARGASEEITHSIITDVNRVNAISRSLNAENAVESRDEAISLMNEVEFKYGIHFDDEEILDGALDNEDEEEEEEVDETQTTSADRKKSGAAVVCGALAGVILVTGAVTTAWHTGLISKYTKNISGALVVTESESENRGLTPSESETEKPTETETEKPTETETEKPTETETEKPTETEQLTLGEYGTFFDVTDAEQVQARAQYIYDNYFAGRTDLDQDQKKLLTVENIANTIRIMNGEMPIDAEGNVIYDGSALNDYTRVLVDLTVNTQSNDNQHYSHFPSHLLFADDSEVSEFVKSYDEIYDKLCHGLNTHDDEEVQDAIACLGFKFNREWMLMGMKGDTNPHSFETEYKYLAMIATVEPYNTTALEWHLSEKQPVCIMACLDYETDAETLVPVNDIHAALETGAWNNIGAKLAGLDNVDNHPWMAEFYTALYDHLNWKYDHLNTLKLN